MSSIFICFLENFNGKGASSYQKLKSLKENLAQKKEAAKIAASTLFHEEPLPGVNSDPWKILWDSAKNYSERIAYQEIGFPNTSDNAICVLCQQNLGHEAKDRMNRFHAFILDDTKQKENLAMVEYQDFLNILKKEIMKYSIAKSIYRFINTILDNQKLSEEVRFFFIKSLLRARAIIRLSNNISPIPAFPQESFDSEYNDICKRITNLTDSDASKTRKLLENEKQELEARKKLGVLKNDIISEIERIKEIEYLENILKQQTATDGITRKSTDISKLLISDALRAQFTKEIDELKVSSLAIELQQKKSGFASPQFKVVLTRSPNIKVGEILSEGEFRCVAIAAFMAELSTTDNKSCIIFDDPISSLDHKHREYTASRLAKEATSRQVVVFTHNLEFLFYLTEACHDTGANLTYEYITKRPIDGATGIHHKGAPPKARSIKERIASLRSCLKKECYYYDQGDENRWYATIRSINDDLRYAWERAVEEIIKPVLSRFSNQVKTPGFVRLTCITRGDCETMRDAMTRISQWHHSDALGLNRNLPTPAEIENKITAIEQWFDDIKSRQDVIKSI